MGSPHVMRRSHHSRVSHVGDVFPRRIALLRGSLAKNKLRKKLDRWKSFAAKKPPEQQDYFACVSALGGLR